MAQARLAQQKADSLGRSGGRGGAPRLGGSQSASSDGDNLRQKRRWNTVGSELDKSLRQGRGKMLPARYRRAIEQYFDSISKKSNESRDAGEATE
jgi:hypothetical protein